MTKCNVLLYSMVIGFGFLAGVHTYMAWSSLLEAIFNLIKAAVLNA